MDRCIFNFKTCAVAGAVVGIDPYSYGFDPKTVDLEVHIFQTCEIRQCFRARWLAGLLTCVAVVWLVEVCPSVWWAFHVCICMLRVDSSAMVSQPCVDLNG